MTQISPDSTETIGVVAAAKLLNVTVRHLRRVARKGTIGKVTQYGWEFTRQELIDYTTKVSQRKPGPKPGFKATRLVHQKRTLPQVHFNGEEVAPAAEQAAIGAAVAHHIGILKNLEQIVTDDRARDYLMAMNDVAESVRLFADAWGRIKQFERGATGATLSDVTSHVQSLVKPKQVARHAPYAVTPAVTERLRKTRDVNAAKLQRVKTRPFQHANPNASMMELAENLPPPPPGVKAIWTKISPVKKNLVLTMPRILLTISSDGRASTEGIMKMLKKAGLPWGFNAVRWALHVLENAKRIKSVKEHQHGSGGPRHFYWRMA